MSTSISRLLLMGMREISPFGIRMPPDLKAELLHQAQMAGRSLNQELILRLRESLSRSLNGVAHNGYTVEEGRASYPVSPTTEIERQLLAEFRNIPVNKQLALLSLIK